MKYQILSHRFTMGTQLIINSNHGTLYTSFSSMAMINFPIIFKDARGPAIDKVL